MRFSTSTIVLAACITQLTSAYVCDTNAANKMASDFIDYGTRVIKVTTDSYVLAQRGDCALYVFSETNQGTSSYM